MLPPIKVKICDRNKSMQQAFGDKSAKVETQDGKILIKKSEDILPTDRIITYIPNDYIKPIKIRIIDLNIIFAFLYGELAKLAFFCKINIDGALILRFGKFNIKLNFFHEIEKPLSTSFGKFYEKILVSAISEKATSTFWMATKATSYILTQSIKLTTVINEKYVLPQPIKINIPPIVNAIVYTLYYKKIGDITTGTLEEQFLNNEMTIGNIFTRKEET